MPRPAPLPDLAQRRRVARLFLTMTLPAYEWARDARHHAEKLIAEYGKGPPTAEEDANCGDLLLASVRLGEAEEILRRVLDRLGIVAAPG